ncbi:polymer-forming cytoskeletal protein [Porticoccaceae bacterium]|nr:polymer-forming cytoskeletal protein [Porticoccaceae bacterium]MDA9014804.1 polymer-forming cytoskeletal protein [Porticoccaceae bacterium]
MKDLLLLVNHRISALIQQLQPMRQMPQADVKLSLVDLVDAKSVLMSDVMVEGELHSDKNLVVDGQFKGTIAAANNTVAIGSNALVYADISAKRVVIQGAIKGDITAGATVELSASARVSGNIQAASVNLEHGARFKGIIEMDPPQEEAIDVPVKQAPTVKPAAMEPG